MISAGFGRALAPNFTSSFNALFSLLMQVSGERDSWFSALNQFSMERADDFAVFDRLDVQGHHPEALAAVRNAKEIAGRRCLRIRPAQSPGRRRSGPPSSGTPGPEPP